MASRALRSACVILLAWSAAPAAQPQEQSRLAITVTDPLDAVIPGAVIELTREGTAPLRQQTGPQGTATLQAIGPGVWALRVSSPGFRDYVDERLTIRAGSNSVRVRLEIAAFLDEVVVSRDPDEMATDPRGDAMTLTLGEEELAALPDDPDDLAQVLSDLAGGAAELSVDGFLDGELPGKEQIERVRIRRMMFSADNHGARRSRIEIITRPGTDVWRSSVQFDFRDAALNARDAYSPTEPPEQRKRLSVSFDGPLVRNRTSLSLDVDGRTSYESQTIRAASREGLIEGSVRQPDERVNVRARLRHALSPSHSAHFEYHHGTAEAGNLGVGDVNLPERAYSETSTRRLVRVGTDSVFGRSLLNELRLQVGWRDEASAAANEAPTIRVLDALTIGGANIRGGRTTRDIDLTDNISLRTGRHALTAGARLQLGAYQSDAIRNLHGTFTFATLGEYESGRPQTYTLRRGDPTVEYSMFQGGWFVHDDLRIRRNLTIGFGLRHEWQSQVDDVWNLSPRVGFAWSPFPGGATTVRGGAGIFYDWYESSTYEETVQVDGTRVQEVTVRQPGFPDPFSGGRFETLPQGRVQASADLRMPTIRRAAIGVERRLGDSIRVSADYEFDDGRNLLRGRNVNAPGPGGVRPVPDVGNVIKIRSIGREKRHEIGAGISARLPWRRLFLTLRYNWQTARDDGDGPLSLPASNAAPDEWGPSGNDIRHRVSAFGSVELPGNVQAGLNLRASSAPPYNITTGRDENGDTVFNDRPAGVSRNAGRGEGSVLVDFRLSWRLDLGSVSGGRRGQEQPGRGGNGGGQDGARRGRGPSSRVSTEVYLRAFNLLNTVNRRGFRGVQLSPFFGLPTSSEPARQIEVGTRIRF